MLKNKLIAAIVTPAVVIASAGVLVAAGPRESAVAGAVGASATAAISEAATYDTDKVHSGVVFWIRHAGVTNFHGRFNEIDGTFTYDEANPTASTFNFEISTESIDTGNNSRDGHLRGSGYFNTKQFPTASFTSSSVKAAGDGFELHGDLTMSGVTRPIVADLTLFGTNNFRGKDVSGFTAEFSFKRADFGMTTSLAPDGGEGGGLGNTVNVTVFVEGIKQG
ncbi:MAG: YceI family protein [Planctomycetota bacterium]